MSAKDGRDAVAQHLASGDREALLAVVYDELRRLAEGYMARERRDHTLQATALVHEAFLRLVAGNDHSWEDRCHFYASVNEAMRRILVEHARRARSEKRGGNLRRVTLGAADDRVDLQVDQTAVVYDAIDRLEEEDPRSAAVARLRFLAGLGAEETAQALSISVRTVQREWRYARAWLLERLGE